VTGEKSMPGADLEPQMSPGLRLDLHVLDDEGRPRLVLGGPPPVLAGPGRRTGPHGNGNGAARRPAAHPATIRRPARLGPGEDWDAVVIGAGPAGSAVAAALARRGRLVTIVDPASPRPPGDGGTLSPACLEAIEETGAGRAVRAAGFVPKTGATFLWGPSDRPWSVRYGGEDAPPAFHVDRTEFDRLMLRNALSWGAAARQGGRVEEVVLASGRASGVVVRVEGGGTENIAARWVIDASGPAAIVARQQGVLRPAANGATAVWGCWTGAGRLLGPGDSDALYVGGPDTCLWCLPTATAPDRVVVGIVVRDGGVPVGPELEDWYGDAVARSAVLATPLAGASRSGPARSAPVGGYAVARAAGPGWLLAGDAAGFVDPVLTPGLQLACQHGVLAARIVDAVLDGADEATALDLYDTVVRRQLEGFGAVAGNFWAAAATRDHGATALPEVAAEEAGAGRADADRLAFLSILSGLSPSEVVHRLQTHVDSRTAAAALGGRPPAPGEQEGFAFLSRLHHDRRLVEARTSHGSPEAAGSLRLAPGTSVAPRAFVDPGGAGLTSRTVATNRFGDRFALTPQLEAALDTAASRLPYPAFVTAVGATGAPDREVGPWLQLLADNALVEWDDPDGQVPSTDREVAGCVG